MMEDIRKHDATPTLEEKDWLESTFVEMMFRAVGLAGFALAIGVAASVLLEGSGLLPAVVAVSGQ